MSTKLEYVERGLDFAIVAHNRDNIGGGTTDLLRFSFSETTGLPVITLGASTASLVLKSPLSLGTGGTLIASSIGPTAAKQHTLPNVASDTFALLGAVQTITGAKTFNNATLLVNNAGATFAHTILSDATAARTVHLPDESGVPVLATYDRLANVANGKGASLIGLEDAGGLYSAVTVEAALAEVKAIADAGMAVVKRTCTINYSSDSFSGLGGGVKTYSENVGAVLPANARVVGYSIGEDSFTAFDDAAHGTYVLEIGTGGDPDQVMQQTSVAAGATGFPKAGTAGVLGFPFAPNSAAQLIAKLTSSVDLNTVTAGNVVVNVFYLVLA